MGGPHPAGERQSPFASPLQTLPGAEYGGPKRFRGQRRVRYLYGDNTTPRALMQGAHA